MKKNLVKYYLGALLLSVAALLPVSCITEDYPQGDKSSVTMTFTARAPEAGTASTLLDNEQMRTLRVIVARSATSEILYNVVYNIEPQETAKTINFSELSIAQDQEDFDFYAIANEAAFLNQGESLEGKNLDLAQLKNRILRKDFNAPALSQVPQAAFKTITVEAGSHKTESMKLQFPVAKVQLNFNNETGEPVSLSNVRIAGISNRGYLFQDVHTDYPQGMTQMGTVLFGNNGAIEVPVTPAADVSPYVRYLYPGEKTEAYKLSAVWGSKTYEVVLNLNGADLKAIAHGQQLNINITLIANSLKVALEVLPWNVDDAVIDFSTEFNALLNPFVEGSLKVVTDASQSKAIAVATANDGKDRTAQFSFKMLSPEGVRWTAHLENTVDFELVGETSGYGGENSGSVTFGVKPKQDYDATSEKSVKLFITVDSPFGNATDNGVQIINPEENGVHRFPGTETEILIQQVSESAFDQLQETIAVIQ